MLLGELNARGDEPTAGTYSCFQIHDVANGDFTRSENQGQLLLAGLGADTILLAESARSNPRPLSCRKRVLHRNRRQRTRARRQGRRVVCRRILGASERSLRLLHGPDINTFDAIPRAAVGDAGAVLVRLNSIAAGTQADLF